MIQNCSASNTTVVIFVYNLVYLGDMQPKVFVKDVIKLLLLPPLLVRLGIEQAVVAMMLDHVTRVQV